MNIHRRTFSPSAIKATLALGTLSGFVCIPQIAFADLPVTTVASFSGAYPEQAPYSNVSFDSSGNLYGTTGGTVYEISKGSNTITTIASFNGGNGSSPAGGVTFDSNGNLFGTTNYGGVSDAGAVYEIAKGSSTITDIASFNYSTGPGPYSGITFDSNGNLYGTSSDGGANGAGAVYEITKGSSTITDIASFNYSTGEGPYSGVTFDSNGNLYGTTEYNGPSGDGGVYEIAKGSSTITDIAPFNNSTGYGSFSGVTFDSNGNLYGTSSDGGANGHGAVYEIAKGSSTITDIASFSGNNGQYSQNGSVIFDSKGNLYGIKPIGGANVYGAVYEIAKGSSSIADIATFNVTSLKYPEGDITLDSSGNFYGAMLSGGANNAGGVFEIKTGDASAAPEPSQLALLALMITGVTGLLLRARRHTDAASAQATAKGA